MNPDGQRPLVLASASPRRRRLMVWLSVPFAVTSADVPEDLGSPLAADPSALACRIASEKAVASRDSGAWPNALVLAFDTIVVLDGAVLGKPRDMADAYRMLEALSGRTHEVVTGCTLLPPGERAPACFAVTTRVRMRDLSAEDVHAWAEEGELLGCAGAYNIERHLAFVQDGECFQNVAGLPLCHLYDALATGAFGGLPGLAEPVAACDAARDTRCSLGRRLMARGGGAG
jgi:septum formation protein